MKWCVLLLLPISRHILTRSIFSAQIDFLKYHDGELTEGYSKIVLPVHAVLPAAYLPSAVLHGASAATRTDPAVAVQEEIVRCYLSLRQARRTLLQVPADMSRGIQTMFTRATRLRDAAHDSFRSLDAAITPWANARSVLLPAATRAGRMIFEATAQADLRLAARLHMAMDAFPRYKHEAHTGPSLEDIARSMSLRLDDIVSEQTERNSYSADGRLVADDDDAPDDM